MDMQKGQAAPESGTSNDDDIPTFEELLRDPEIAALLDFEPVPRRNKKEGGWSPQMQRLFIARLAVHGSPGKACDQVGMYRSGVDKVAKSKGSESFREAWDKAVELADRRRAAEVAAGHASMANIKLPFVDNRRKLPAPEPDHSGEVRNEYGEWEDSAAFDRRVEEARDSMSQKLRMARRLYLQEISHCPGKRAAFEILTELPIDWDQAAECLPQDDEPWRRPNFRQPDMLLTAENGWLGAAVHGPDKVAELRRQLDEYRASEGLPAVDWSESTGRNET